jgi:hypothetical protein
MKNEKKKNSIPPVLFLVIGIVIVGIFAFALLREQPAPKTTQVAPAEQTQNNDQKRESIIPDPASDMASIPEAQQPVEFRIPVFHENVDALTLPAVKDPSTVAPEARAAYTIVQNKPKLIAQLPCFCYCERWGHGSLHDCFVTEHAVTCDVCMNEAIQADKLDQQGVSAAEIRETIVAQYRAAAADDHAGHNH